MSTYGLTYTRKTLAPAKGRREGGRLKVAVAFEPKEFHRLSDLAWQRKISMAELIRRLCEIGGK